MAPPISCSRCGAAMTADGPLAGLCPRCMLDQRPEDETAPANHECVRDDETSAGPYRLLQLLGEGGMGMVYLAEQTEPIHRTVALKLIKLGMDSRAVIARFDSERQALAMMDHPNVAQIYDAGATSLGRPYFVMEYVPGVPISVFCEQSALGLRDRLELFVQVANGIQHAHEKGMIHRDLKPSNVMVTVQDGCAVPKIIDFGLAKAIRKHLAEKTFYTETGILVGTPEYMSPEQAAMSERVDTRTDIYSLGVLLYELLVGVRPFDFRELPEADYIEVLRVIREDDPPIPSARARSLGKAALAGQLSGDLDWITMKALEKEPARRYASASELAADIRRYLHDEPVTAAPLTALYRVRKFVRKNRIKVASALAVLICLTAGLCASTYLYFRAERRRVDAERLRMLTERQSYAGNLAAAQLNLVMEAPAAAQQSLHACPPGLRGWEWRHLSYASDPSLIRLDSAGRFFRHPYRHPFAPSFGFSTDGATIYWHTTETVEAWHGSEYKKAGDDRRGFGEILAMSRDGTKVAAGSPQETNVLRVFDVGSGKLESEFREHMTDVRCAAFSFDARRIISASSDGALLAWDARSGSTLARMQGNCPLAFNPDGHRILCGAQDATLAIKDLKLAGPVSLEGHSRLVYSAAFSRDGSRLVSASADGTARVWDAQNGALLAILHHNEEVRDAAFSPDGRWIATAGSEATIRVWEAASGELATTLLNTYGNSVAFTPDGKRIVAGSETQTVRAWEAVHYRGNIWRQADKRFGSIAASARRVAAGFADGTLEVWDALSGATVASWRGHQGAVRSVALSPDGTRLLSGSDDWTAYLWDAISGAPLAEFRGHGGAVLSVALSPDGSRIVTGAEDGTARLWVARPGSEIASVRIGQPVSSALFSPDGSAVLLGSGEPARLAVQDPVVQLWKPVSGASPVAFRARSEDLGRRAPAFRGGSQAPPIPVAFSPDGQRILAAFGFYDQIRVYPIAETGSILANLRCERGLTSFVVSPDGSRIVAGTSGGVVQIWDAENHDPLLKLTTRDRDPVEAVAFTLDGSRLLALTRGGVRAWDSQPPYGSTEYPARR